jgi:hypothetical protein
MGQVEKDGHLTQDRAWFPNQGDPHPTTNDLNHAFDEDIQPVGLPPFVEKYRSWLEC